MYSMKKGGMKKYQGGGTPGAAKAIGNAVGTAAKAVGKATGTTSIIDKISNAAKSALDSKPAQIAKKVIGYHKTGGSVGTSKKPKMQKGGSFGMLSVKAGVDNNPKPTAADRIAGAKMKKGGSVGKPKMKMGGSMKSKKC